MRIEQVEALEEARWEPGLSSAFLSDSKHLGQHKAAAQRPREEGDWWCPRCKDYLSWQLVDYYETHAVDHCGATVQWVAINEEPTDA